jgi:hypothetical protein
VSQSVWHRTRRRVDLNPLLRLLDEVQTPNAGQRVLWFCANKDDRKGLKGSVLTKREAGTLLGYPSCCVEFQVENDAKSDIAFMNALTNRVGGDEQAILRASKEDLKVEIPDDVHKVENVPRTDAQFPFVMHVACDSCLGSDDSPSAGLNASYQALARYLDPALEQLILRVCLARGWRLSTSNQSGGSSGSPRNAWVKTDDAPNESMCSPLLEGDDAGILSAIPNHLPACFVIACSPGLRTAAQVST